MVPIKTKLISSRILPYKEVPDGLEVEQWTALREACRNDEYITVACEAADGYWDVDLANGMAISALSGYYFKGFTDDGQPSIENFEAVLMFTER